MNLYWLQSGGCSGDSMSMLNCECNLYEIFDSIDANVLWHPSLSNISYHQHLQIIEDIKNDKLELDVLCVEGNVVLGPNNTGMFDTFDQKPKKDLIKALAHKAKYVVAVGTCASFGGFGSNGDDMQGVGLQFLHFQKGGFLGENFKSKSGYPVINLPGCPIQPKTLTTLLENIYFNIEIKLTQTNTLLEYHEYKVEENDFGERGCMFFHLGCKGPTTNAPCNKYLWNEVNSKTRAGVPCFGCTRPDFPQSYAFFKTRDIVGTPLELPKGVDRAHYLAYKDMAGAAAPQRLLKRSQKV
jgi:hydrogenase small subunit